MDVQRQCSLGVPGLVALGLKITRNRLVANSYGNRSSLLLLLSQILTAMTLAEGTADGCPLSSFKLMWMPAVRLMWDGGICMRPPAEEVRGMPAMRHAPGSMHAACLWT